MALRARAVVCMLAAAVGCGGSPEPAAEATPPVTATPAPAPGPDRLPRCSAADASAPRLTDFGALAAGTDALHWVAVRFDRRYEQWLPTEPIGMPLHHATAIRWTNVDDFAELDGARGEQLRFTFRTLSRDTQHHTGGEHGDRWETTYRVRIESMCSDSADEGRPEGVLVAPAELDTSGCGELETAMAEAAADAARCQADSDCVVHPVPVCEVEGLGCHWVALDRNGSVAPLTGAIHRYLEEPCVSAECDCPAPPEGARCVEGRCHAHGPAAPAGASAEPSAPEPTQTCWCFAWVHGPDHGNDCFLARAACTRNRRERGPSGETRACERTEQRRCERTGYHDGRLHNLGPTRPRAQQILGKTLAQLRRDLGAPTGREAGWHRFGLHLAIQVVDGRARRVRVRVDEGTGCAEVVRAEGFPEAGAPLRRASGCEWPGISERHRLDERGRVAGRLDRATSTLEVWLRR